MDRINLILYNKNFVECLNNNYKFEKKRKFCNHNIVHILDTARISYIINIENNYGIEKDIVYAVALLHDIGRWKQYRDNVPHEVASAEIAENILGQCNFEKSEISMIISAITAHRNSNSGSDILSQIIYKGDKLSRKCFCCESREKCNWPDSRKNYTIKY